MRNGIDKATIKQRQPVGRENGINKGAISSIPVKQERVALRWIHVHAKQVTTIYNGNGDGGTVNTSCKKTF